MKQWHGHHFVVGECNHFHVDEYNMKDSQTLHDQIRDQVHYIDAHSVFFSRESGMGRQSRITIDDYVKITIGKQTFRRGILLTGSTATKQQQKP